MPSAPTTDGADDSSALEETVSRPPGASTHDERRSDDASTVVRTSDAPRVQLSDLGPLGAVEPGRRYELGARLGEGGMGVVQACRDQLIGRELAIKVIRPEANAAADLRRRFVREARVQGQLEHPSVVPVYELGERADGTVFFTMKRVRGHTLGDIIEGLKTKDAALTQRFSRRKLVSVFAQVCVSLEFAHRRGVIHRDLKPGNLMLGDYGEVYVLDWGLARLMGVSEASEPTLVLDGPSSADTEYGTVMGTPGYMAPEQVTGDVDRIDARTDIYSLGVILFEVLTFHRLHRGKSRLEVMNSTLQGDDTSPARRYPEAEVPPELDAVCRKATALNPQQRYQSVQEMVDEVERYLDGDRDLALRRALAQEHADRAQGLVAGQVIAQVPEAKRKQAMEEVLRALALDPARADALQLMARLLAAVPDEVPPEAEAELAEAVARSRATAARASVVRYMSWAAFVPLLMAMEVRNWAVAGAAIGLVAASLLGAWWLSRQRAPTVAHGLALLIASTAGLAAVTGVFGPLILVPGLAATNTMVFCLYATARQRVGAIAVGLLSVVAPLVYEWAGGAPAYDFVDGALRVNARVTEFPATWTMATLTLTSVAVVITPSLLVGRIRDNLADAERRLTLHAWHLRRMLPSASQPGAPTAR